jgi:Ca2+-transporting ATPase
MHGAMSDFLAEAHAWHGLTAEATASQFRTDPHGGLTAREAAARLERCGPNDIAQASGGGWWRLLLRQFADVMILVLILAALVSGAVGEPRDAMVILVIVGINALVGAVQEYRAQRSLEALRELAAPRARVVRDGRVTVVPGRELVPGDLVVLEAGDVVGADLRLLHVADLQVDESALTGESLPVSKSVVPVADEEAPLGDRHNMAFRGTLITRGVARGIAVATGGGSEMGRIAQLLKDEKGVRTPLQRRLSRFGTQLALAVVVICALVFALGTYQGNPPLLMFLTAVSLAVAAVPEALPAVATVALAMGARSLGRQQALVRRLPAVETLGSVTYICSDKTGTLTENRMSLERLLIDGDLYERWPEPGDARLWQRLGEALALCNDVEADDDGTLTGDPTETALVEAAARAGYGRNALAERLPRIGELAFDSARKRMTTLHRDRDCAVAFVKGAPEQVLARCCEQLTEAGVVPVDTQALGQAADALAAKGYRVLAVACRELADSDVLPTDALEERLCLLALVGLMDPPRAEAAAAVADCRTAGIVPVMITGDHPDTARSIAVRLGIAAEGAPVVTGSELATWSDEELATRVRELAVYARVDPAQKIRIVAALQARGEFVAMTGDGVNDAPALKRAGIGIAMGQRGTEVAREAAEMVLLDDNFATIVAAVKEGRRIFDDIRKFIKYTMSSNAGEILTLLLAPLLGLPIPLLPIQILWVNLVTDGLPGLALSVEPAERDVMRRPPRPPDESIFARGMWQHIVLVGLSIGVLSVAVQAWAIDAQKAHWQTMVFTFLVVAQLFHSLAIRAERDSMLRRDRAANPALLAAVLLTLGLQLAVIYVPALNAVFYTTPLPAADLALCLLLGAVVPLLVELEKWRVRRGLLSSPG